MENTFYREHSTENTFYREHLQRTHSTENTFYREHSTENTFYREHILQSKWQEQVGAVEELPKVHVVLERLSTRGGQKREERDKVKRGRRSGTDSLSSKTQSRNEKGRAQRRGKAKRERGGAAKASLETGNLGAKDALLTRRQAGPAPLRARPLHASTLAAIRLQQ